jgi:hypothetical protein
VSADDYAFRLRQLSAAFAMHRLHLPELQSKVDALWEEIEQAGLGTQVLAALR